MTEKRNKELEGIALRVREHIVRMATHGGCFIGASLSCADILVYLYTEVLDLSPGTIRDPERDYLFLSKGHDVPALYGTLAELGFLDPGRLDNHLQATDVIYWHPHREIHGVEFHSGSLGHLLAVGMGVAIDIKRLRTQNRVFVILGDGELNEGSIWEGALIAGAFKLDNLVAVVDRNQFQANLRTEELIPLEPITKKFEAFGWSVARANGHSFPALEKALRTLPLHEGHPTLIIADTIRGKGLPSIEQRADRWFVDFTSEEISELLRELHGGSVSRLISEPLTVR